MCTPAASELVLHVAVLLLPVPLNATAPQPTMVVPPSVKLTVPVGAAPATVAVNVTLDPAEAGLPEPVRVVVDNEGVDPQLPCIIPTPSRRNVVLAKHPATIGICSGDPPPRLTGVIGCGDWNETSLEVFE